MGKGFSTDPYTCECNEWLEVAQMQYGPWSCKILVHVQHGAKSFLVNFVVDPRYFE